MKEKTYINYSVLLNEFFYHFKWDEVSALLILAAEAATLRVGHVRVQTSIAVYMPAFHHHWRDDQVQTDGALESLTIQK